MCKKSNSSFGIPLLRVVSFESRRVSAIGHVRRSVTCSPHHSNGDTMAARSLCPRGRELLLPPTMRILKTATLNCRRIVRGLSSLSRLFPENLNVLYDSKCSLCQIEISFLKSKDKFRRIRFTDIESADYHESDPKNGNISYEEAMRRLHAVRSNGEVLQGTDVIRAMYAEVDLGWWYAFTKFPVIRSIIDLVYDVWADYRTIVTRGESLRSILERRKSTNCMEGRCQSKLS